MTRMLLVICDGLGDRPVPQLGGRTPLQAARTPTLDAMAAEGSCGQIDPIGPGIVAGSDTSHLALLGYDPYRYYSGRGPIEAMGVGLRLRGGDLALRFNFATVIPHGGELIVSDRRAGRIDSQTGPLAAALDGTVIDGVTFLVKEGTEHRGALVLRGEGLSTEISDVDPHREGGIARCRATAPQGERTAALLNAFTAQSHQVLSTHPVNLARVEAGKGAANCLLARGGGVLAPLPPLSERHHITVLGIAGVALIKGLCHWMGMEVAEVPGATGALHSDYVAKVEAALKSSHDLVVINFKAPDIAGHDGDAQAKVAAIERIDAAMGHVRSRFDGIVALTADHCTPVTTKEHSGDTVPLLMWGPGVRQDGVRCFDEIAVASGALGRLPGTALMPILLQLAGRSEKYGA